MTESFTTGESRKVMKGSPASPGVVIAEAYVIPSVLRNIPRKVIDAKNIPAEIKKFNRALMKTRKEVLESQKSIGKKLGKEIGRIFDAHLLILEDDLLIEETSDRIQSETVNAEYAFFQTISNYLEKLGQVDDDYLREREVDIRDVGRRIVMNISGGKGFSIPRFNKRVIIVVRELSPSMTATLTRNKVSGIATDASGKTSHAVIFARSLEIPAVIGLSDVTQNVSTGDTVILDGIAGLVILNPDDEEIEKYNEKVRQYREFEEELSHLHSLPAVTVDGHNVHLSANIEIPLETKSVISHGAKGVGLFRTEFLLLNRENESDEDEQFKIYSQVVKKLAPEPVVIRTFDIGGDKLVKFINDHHEQNPYLGWRAIRICLEHESLFRTQLRAILRSTVRGNLKIMFPLITCLEELERAISILKEEENKLREEGIEFDEGYETGIMIETPAAAVISDILAKTCGIFSVLVRTISSCIPWRQTETTPGCPISTSLFIPE